MKKLIATASLIALCAAAPAFAQTTEEPSTVPAPQATTPGPGAPETPTVQSAGDWRASKLLGEEIYNAENQNIGEIEDLILDNSGRVASVLVGVGGFLGIGDKKVALAFDQLMLRRDDNGDLMVKSKVSKQTLESAPEYKEAVAQ